MGKKSCERNLTERRDPWGATGELANRVSITYECNTPKNKEKNLRLGAGLMGMSEKETLALVQKEGGDRKRKEVSYRV